MSVVIPDWDEHGGKGMKDVSMNEIEKITNNLPDLPAGRRIYDRLHAVFGDHRWFLVYELGDEGIPGAECYLTIPVTEDEAFGDHPGQVFYERLRDSWAVKIILHPGGEVEHYQVEEWIALKKTPEKDEDYLCIEWRGEEAL